MHVFLVCLTLCSNMLEYELLQYQSGHYIQQYHNLAPGPRSIRQPEESEFWFLHGLSIHEVCYMVQICFHIKCNFVIKWNCFIFFFILNSVFLDNTFLSVIIIYFSTIKTNTQTNCPNINCDFVVAVSLFGLYLI